MILNPDSSDSSGSLDRTVSEGEVVRKILATDPVIYAWMFCDVALLRAPGLPLLVLLSLVTEDNALSGVPLPISWEARAFCTVPTLDVFCERFKMTAGTLDVADLR